MYLGVLLEIAFVLATLPAVFSQKLYPSQRMNIGNCPVLSNSSDIFGNRTDFSNQGLLPSLFIGGDGNDPLTLRILRVHLLCEAIGLYRNTASSVAYLVEYEVPSNSTPRLAQVMVDCIEDRYNPSANYSFYPLPPPGSIQVSEQNTARNSLTTTLITDSSLISSNFSTLSAYMCGLCGVQGGIFADQATRCLFCSSSCTQGMRRCLGRDNNQCCSWFLNDTCVQFCPSPLVGNPDTFDCGCSPLSISGGMVTYSDAFLTGSVATFTCDETSGYILTVGSPSTRTCTMSGWTDTNATCASFDCKMADLQKPDNGEFTLDNGTTTFGSVVTFKCSDSYKLNGEGSRTCGLVGWSGKNPTCGKDSDLRSDGLPTSTIILIVVFCFVAVILLVVLSAVIVGVLFYCNKKKKNPSQTPMSKFQNEE